MIEQRSQVPELTEREQTLRDIVNRVFTLGGYDIRGRVVPALRLDDTIDYHDLYEAVGERSPADFERIRSGISNSAIVAHHNTSEIIVSSDQIIEAFRSLDNQPDA